MKFFAVLLLCVALCHVAVAKSTTEVRGPRDGASTGILDSLGGLFGLLFSPIIGFYSYLGDVRAAYAIAPSMGSLGLSLRGLVSNSLVSIILTILPLPLDILLIIIIDFLYTATCIDGVYNYGVLGTVVYSLLYILGLAYENSVGLYVVQLVFSPPCVDAVVA